MKILTLLLLYITVTCQAQQWPINGQQVARQGNDETDLLINDRLFEKLKTEAKKYMNQKDDEENSNMLTRIVPGFLKPDPQPSRRLFQKASNQYLNNRVTNQNRYQKYHRPVPSQVHNRQQQYSRPAPYRFASPVIFNRFRVDEEDQIPQTPQAEQRTQHLKQSEVEPESRFAQIDKEVLSKLSEEDRQILETQLSATEREALLTELEDAQLDDILPKEENRFGGTSTSPGGFSSTAAQIGATAGRYIGNKLAGSLGARLGAAAGAYLGAAAASRFVKKPEPSEGLRENSLPDGPVQYYGNSFGAVMVKQ